MHLPPFFTAFNTKSALIKSRLLPVKTSDNHYPLTCTNCKFINLPEYHFCTNCGYPVYPNKDNVAIYNLRLSRRKAIEKSCSVKILQARNAMYILAGIMVLGIFYLFSDEKQGVIKGVVMLVSGGIYAGLGKWSLTRPFTSLLIGLMIIITFSAISIWAEFSKRGAGFDTFYMIFIQGIFIYFLWQGVKAAFMADVLEEEFKI